MSRDVWDDYWENDSLYKKKREEKLKTLENRRLERQSQLQFAEQEANLRKIDDVEHKQPLSNPSGDIWDDYWANQKTKEKTFEDDVKNAQERVAVDDIVTKALDGDNVDFYDIAGIATPSTFTNTTKADDLAQQAYVGARMEDSSFDPTGFTGKLNPFSKDFTVYKEPWMDEIRYFYTNPGSGPDRMAWGENITQKAVGGLLEGMHPEGKDADMDIARYHGTPFHDVMKRWKYEGVPSVKEQEETLKGIYAQEYYDKMANQSSLERGVRSAGHMATFGLADPYQQYLPQRTESDAIADNIGNISGMLASFASGPLKLAGTIRNAYIAKSLYSSRAWANRFAQAVTAGTGIGGKAARISDNLIKNLLAFNIHGQMHETGVGGTLGDRYESFTESSYTAGIITGVGGLSKLAAGTKAYWPAVAAEFPLIYGVGYQMTPEDQDDPFNDINKHMGGIMFTALHSMAKMSEHTTSKKLHAEARKQGIKTTKYVLDAMGQKYKDADVVKMVDGELAKYKNDPESLNIAVNNIRARYAEAEAFEVKRREAAHKTPKAEPKEPEIKQLEAAEVDTAPPTQTKMMSNEISNLDKPTKTDVQGIQTSINEQRTALENNQTYNPSGQLVDISAEAAKAELKELDAVQAQLDGVVHTGVKSDIAPHKRAKPASNKKIMAFIKANKLEEVDNLTDIRQEIFGSDEIDLAKVEPEQMVEYSERLKKETGFEDKETYDKLQSADLKRALKERKEKYPDDAAELTQGTVKEMKNRLMKHDQKLSKPVVKKEVAPVVEKEGTVQGEAKTATGQPTDLNDVNVESTVGGVKQLRTHRKNEDGTWEVLTYDKKKDKTGWKPVKNKKVIAKAEKLWEAKQPKAPAEDSSNLEWLQGSLESARVGLKEAEVEGNKELIALHKKNIAIFEERIAAIEAPAEDVLTIEQGKQVSKDLKAKKKEVSDLDEEYQVLRVDQGLPKSDPKVRDALIRRETANLEALELEKKQLGRREAKGFDLDTGEGIITTKEAMTEGRIVEIDADIQKTKEFLAKKAESTDQTDVANIKAEKKIPEQIKAIAEGKGLDVEGDVIRQILDQQADIPSRRVVGGPEVTVMKRLSELDAKSINRVLKAVSKYEPDVVEKTKPVITEKPEIVEGPKYEPAFEEGMDLEKSTAEYDPTNPENIRLVHSTGAKTGQPIVKFGKNYDPARAAELESKLRGIVESKDGKLWAPTMGERQGLDRYPHEEIKAVYLNVMDKSPGSKGKTDLLDEMKKELFSQKMDKTNKSRVDKAVHNLIDNGVMGNKNFFGADNPNYTRKQKFEDAAWVAADVIRKGAKNFKQFAKEMFGRLGKNVKAILSRLWKSGKKYVKDYWENPKIGASIVDVSRKPVIKSRHLDNKVLEKAYKTVPNPPDAENRLRISLERDVKAGRPINKRRVLQNDNLRITLGDRTHKDWVDDVSYNMSKKEIAEAREWYGTVRDKFIDKYGKEGDKYLLGFLASQMNASPIEGMANALRVFEQEAAGRSGKKGGLADTALRQIARGEQIEKGFGAKLFDFVDSAFGSVTRRVMGNMPAGGKPVVVDIHTSRDRGFISPTYRRILEKMFGKDKLRKLKLDRDGESPTEPQYEQTVKWFNELTDYLNKNNVMGGKWTPEQVQAVGWMNLIKISGRAGETPEMAMGERTANVAVELDFGEGAPYNKEFPKFGKLSPERKAEVTKNMVEHVSNDIESLTGVKVLSKEHGTGYWMDYGGQPNTAIKLIGSKKGVEEAMSYLGLALQQTEVYGSKPSIRGTGAAIQIFSKDLTKEKADKLYAALRKAHPDIIIGASPETVTVDGKNFPALNFGIEVKSPSKLKVAERIKHIEKYAKEVVDLIDPTLSELDIDVESQAVVTENMSVSNNWKENPDGKEYLQRFSERPEGPSIQERLDSDIVPRFKERLRRELAGKEPTTEVVPPKKQLSPVEKQKALSLSIDAGFMGFTPQNMKLLADGLINTGKFLHKDLPKYMHSAGKKVGVTAENFKEKFNEYAGNPDKAPKKLANFFKRVWAHMKKWYNQSKEYVKDYMKDPKIGLGIRLQDEFGNPIKMSDVEMKKARTRQHARVKMVEAEITGLGRRSEPLITQRQLDALQRKAFTNAGFKDLDDAINKSLDPIPNESADAAIQGYQNIILRYVNKLDGIDAAEYIGDNQPDLVLAKPKPSIKEKFIRDKYIKTGPVVRNIRKNKIKDPEISADLDLVAKMRNKSIIKSGGWIRKLGRGIAQTDHYMENIQRYTGLRAYDAWSNVEEGIGTMDFTTEKLQLPVLELLNESFGRIMDIDKVLPKMGTKKGGSDIRNLMHLWLVNKANPEKRAQIEQTMRDRGGKLIEKDGEKIPLALEMSKVIEGVYANPEYQEMVRISRMEMATKKGDDRIPGVEQGDFEALKILREEALESGNHTEYLDALANTKGFLIEMDYAPERHHILESDIFHGGGGVGQGHLYSKGMTEPGGPQDAIDNFFRATRQFAKSMHMEEPMLDMLKIADTEGLPEAVRDEIRRSVVNLNEPYVDDVIVTGIRNWVGRIMQTGLTRVGKWVRNMFQRGFKAAYASGTQTLPVMIRTLRRMIPGQGVLKFRKTKEFKGLPEDLKYHFISNVSNETALSKEYTRTANTPILNRMPVIGSAAKEVIDWYKDVDSSSRYGDFMEIYASTGKQLEQYRNGKKTFKQIKPHIYWNHLPISLRERLNHELDAGNIEYVARKVAESMANRLQYKYGTHQRSTIEKSAIGKTAMYATVFPRTTGFNFADDMKRIYFGLRNPQMKGSLEMAGQGFKAMAMKAIMMSFIEKQLNEFFGYRNFVYGHGYRLFNTISWGMGSLAMGPFDLAGRFVAQTDKLWDGLEEAIATNTMSALDDPLKAFTQGVASLGGGLALQQVVFLQWTTEILEHFMGRDYHTLKPLRETVDLMWGDGGWEQGDREKGMWNLFRTIVGNNNMGYQKYMQERGKSQPDILDVNTWNYWNDPISVPDMTEPARPLSTYQYNPRQSLKE
jgi:hypothetical protein